MHRWTDGLYSALWVALGLISLGAVALDWKVFLYSPGPGPFIFVLFGLFALVVGIGHIKAWRLSRVSDVLGGALLLAYALAMFVATREDLGGIGGSQLGSVARGAVALAAAAWCFVNARRGFRRAA
jgi:hypothetical protein